MRLRDSIIQDTTTHDDSETITHDINVNKPITALQVYYTAKNGGTSNKSNWLWECISKIELVDGSNVLYSLSAPQAQGLAFYGHGIVARDYLCEGPSLTQACDIWIPFGRKLYDKTYALDPSKYKNLQLKTTHNLAAVNAVGATAFLTGNCKSRVIAKLMEDTPAPRGFLMSKEHYQYDTGSSSVTKYLDLPTDYPYRALMYRVFVANKNGHEIAQEVKLNIDQESYVPFDLTGSDLAELGVQLRGYANEGIRAYGQHNSTVDQMVMDSRRYGLTIGSRVANVNYACIGAANRVTIGAYTTANAAYGTDADIQIWAQGVAKHGCMIYPFGDIDTPEDWLDAKKYGSIRFEPKTEGWSAAASVVLQQLKNY